MTECARLLRGTVDQLKRHEWAANVKQGFKKDECHSIWVTEAEKFLKESKDAND